MEQTPITKIDFNTAERRVVEEQFQAYMQTLTVIARLHDIGAEQLPTIQLAPDRSGLLIPVPPIKEVKK